MSKVIKFITDVRTWYAVIGIVISIIAHELFHIAAHIGDIQKIEIFPTFYTIVEVTVDNSPSALTHDAEELIAYTITVLILFLTVVDVFAITDSRDRRTSQETLFPEKKQK